MMEKLPFDRRRSRVKFCPCGKKNDDGKFAPFKGFEDKGHCHSCGKTFHPDSEKSDEWRTVHSGAKYQVQPELVPDFIPHSIFDKLCKEGDKDQNHFLQWLANKKRMQFKFDIETVDSLIEKYYLITYRKHWILFPYIDTDRNLRDIKAMDYNPATGKRIAVKNGDIEDRCHFIGKKLLSEQGFSEPNLKRCFYGEHLLKGNSKPVKIFESEATATYAAVFFPDSVCLATGGKNGCKWTEKSVFRVLRGRKVTLYPDIDAHEEWEANAVILKLAGIEIIVSGIIKDHALKMSKQQGIAYDELKRQKFDLRDILKFKIPPAPKATTEPQPAARPAEAVKPLPTPEDIIFSKMAAKYPKLQQFATMLDLVSAKTGKPFEIVPIEAPVQAEPATEPVQASTEQAPTEEAIRKLDAIAERILMPQQSYTAEEVQQLMEATLKISSDRAKAGTQKMIDSGAIQPTGNNRYYLRDSTPF